MEPTINTDNVQEFVQQLHNFDIRPAANNTIQKFIAEALLKAKELAPRRTSILASSIQPEVVSDFKGRIYTTIPYAAFQEFGTGIYGAMAAPIRPKTAKFLVFKGKDGRIIRAKSVKGSKAIHYMQQAFDYVKEKSSGLIQGLGAQIVNTLAK